MKQFLALLLFYLLILTQTHAAVILQYHHVSNETPTSTSIAPLQFEAHMQFLADNGYRVVPLSDIMNSIKKQQPIADKTIAITFDDAYLDILQYGKPILDRFKFPFTIFVNPGIVEQNKPNYLSWQQLKQMADDGVIIANHGFNHDSVARIPDGQSQQQWLNEQAKLLLESERMIEAKTGQSWYYFAYPYGEYTPEIEQWLKDLDFIAFSQQSGAVGLATSLTSVPRFPASQPYDKLTSLKDKLASLPFAIHPSKQDAQTIFPVNTVEKVTFEVVVDDFHPSQLNCYISGLGRQEVQWQDDSSFTIEFSKPLPVGRVRCNCTAPSISQPGRYYWYSKPWFILKENNQWYPL
ncbi:polysaccharide deacetylase family protein [Thalassotalea sp. G2M2-11]|uniref:polysaccharide deacetylase family protein n=1 Tax=Thalassotalea sp. G2M2-11 TaxID=2787627 RepID=UPI0019D1F3E2|nr:polysaccharide deacetylase family protein [Thalassotalea sp. G2M2-11]